MALYHFSEDPSITRFAPHVAKTSSIQHEALVWAIDDWHAPMYFTPRDCPRACFWAGPKTSTADRERWLSGLEPRFVMAVEASWLGRIRSTLLYRYTLPEGDFVSQDANAGHHVSRTPLEPLSVEPVGDLLDAIAAAGVELRLTQRLGPLWRRVCLESTLQYSGTRLRNAAGYPNEFE